MAEDIHRLSGELARDPSSLVFLELGEALRRDGELDVAFKIGLRGIERHPTHADAHTLVARIALQRGDFARASEAWGTVLRLVPGHAEATAGLGHLRTQQGRLEVEELDPACVFTDVLIDDAQTALLLDSNGYVLGGLYVDGEGNDLAQEIGAQLSGISDEVVRATRHLDIGAWRSILFETEVAVVALAPAADDCLLVVAASRATPLGLLRRLLERCARRSAAWLQRGDGSGGLLDRQQGGA